MESSILCGITFYQQRKQAIIGLGHVILFLALSVGNLEFYVNFPVKERRAAVIAAETAAVLIVSENDLSKCEVSYNCN